MTQMERDRSKSGQKANAHRKADGKRTGSQNAAARDAATTSTKQRPKPARHRMAANKTPFLLAPRNPFDAESDGEAHAAFQHVRTYEIATRGDLYSALLEHTRLIYSGTDRQLHAVALQYLNYVGQHAGSASVGNGAEAKQKASTQKPVPNKAKRSPPASGHHKRQETPDAAQSHAPESAEQAQPLDNDHQRVASEPAPL